MADDHDDLVVRLQRGQDRRSIGEADQVAADAIADAAILDGLVDLMAHADPGVAMRAADALEKATRADPAPLQRHTRALLSMTATAEQQEVRWHLAQLVARLALEPSQAVRLASQLVDWLDDDSQIVRVNVLQALVDIACDHPRLVEDVTALVVHHGSQGRPAVRARCRRLLTQLQQFDDQR